MAGNVSISNTFVINTVEDGEDAYSVELSPNTVALECNANGDVKNFGGTTIIPKMYKGATQVSATLSNASVNKGLYLHWATISGVLSLTIYGRFYTWYKGSGANRVYAYTLKTASELSEGDTVLTYNNNTFEIMGEVVSVSSTSSADTLVFSDGTTEYTYGHISSVDDLVANLATPATLTFTLTSNGVSRGVETQITGNKTGETGKTGKAYYYAGDWSNSLTMFTCNDYETPFFQYSTDSTKKYWVYIGAQGRITMRAMGTPSSQNPNFKLMVTDFKFLISEAIFTDFARLGKWYFNGDYQFSEYGVDSSGVEVHYDATHIFYGHDDARNTYIPNTYMDAKTGHIYTQDITLQGVLNNMINNLVVPTGEEIGNLNKYGSYYIDGQGVKLYLNPLRCGQYLDYDFKARFLNIILPSYCISDVLLPIKEVVDDDGSETVTKRFTLSEMRQMVGKKIVMLPSAIGGNPPSLSCNLMFYKYFQYISTNHIGTQVNNESWQDLGYYIKNNTSYNISDGDLSVVQTVIQKTSSLSFWNQDQIRVLRAECKSGIYKGHECIYWEVEKIGAALDTRITFYLNYLNSGNDDEVMFTKGMQKGFEFNTYGNKLVFKYPNELESKLLDFTLKDENGSTINMVHYDNEDIGSVEYGVYHSQNAISSGLRSYVIEFNPLNT